MNNINKLLRQARKAKNGNGMHVKHEELEKAISRMTTEQLRELVYDDPSDERLKEIFASVGGLHLLESG